jgi:glycosyltransferase involved in cell wall biosynthesis
VRVLIAHNHYRQPGGEDVVFSSEGALLAGKGHTVFRYTEQNSTLATRSRTATAVGALWSERRRRDLLRIIRRFRPDVVHFHNTFPLISPAAYYACSAEGVPVIQTLHNYRLICPSATFFRRGRVCEDCLASGCPWPAIVHKCYRRSRIATAVGASVSQVHRWLRTWQNRVDSFVALSEFSRAKFVQWHLPGRKIHVKPNFVHPDPGTGTGTGDYVLYVGRLSAEKGIRTLLTAWRRLGKIPLRIVGYGPLEEEVRGAAQRNPTGKIRLLGRRSREQVFELMKEARIVVLPSEWYEGFPMVIIEAFACGAPVIAAALGAMREIVDHDRTGLLFTPGDPEELAGALEWLWSRREAARKMGLAARAEFERSYTAERNYGMLMEIYAAARRLAAE